MESRIRREVSVRFGRKQFESEYGNIPRRKLLTSCMTKWSVATNLGDYQEGSDRLGNFINIRYHLVDINALDPNALMSSLNAISAIIAVDKERGKDFQHVLTVASKILRNKVSFESAEDFDDFCLWLVHALTHLNFSEDKAAELIERMRKGDDVEMTSSIEVAGNMLVEEGIIDAAIRKLKKGQTFDFVVDDLELSDREVSSLREKSLENGLAV